MSVKETIVLIKVMIVLSLIAAFPGIAIGQSAQSIVETMQAKKKAREKGLGSYIVDQTTAGQRQLLYFEKDYKADNQFRLIAPAEIATDGAMKQGWTPDHSKGFMAGMTFGTGEIADVFRQELGLSGADPISQGMRMGVVGMMGMTAELPTTDQYIQQKQKDGQAAKQEVLDIKEFGQMAKVTGSESVYGRDAFVLKAENLNRTQSSKEGQFTIETASMWVDKAHYVPLRIRFEGFAKSGSKTQPMVIERDSYKYETAGPLLLPRAEIFRLSGIMNDEQQAEMKKAQQEIEKMKAELKGPQADMIMKMMAPQLAQLEAMAKGGGVEVLTEVEKVIVPASRESYMVALQGGDGALDPQ